MMKKWKEMREKESFWAFLGFLIWVFALIICLFWVFLAIKNEAKACDFTLDEGLSWVDGRTYYLPAELIYEDFEESKWVAFRGSNGMVYEVNDEILEQIWGSKETVTDGIYLLTMDSNGTKEWYDDAILVVWRSIL